MTAEKKVADILPGGVTPAQLGAWKQRWGEVYAFSIKSDDEGTVVTGYFKKPDLITIAASATKAEADPVGSGIIVFENCWLGGDESIRTNDEQKFAAIREVNKLFRIRAVEVKKM